MPSVLIPKIRGCARCGGEHVHVIAQEFSRKETAPSTHWALCPVSGDPVLINVSAEPEERQ